MEVKFLKCAKFPNPRTGLGRNPRKSVRSEMAGGLKTLTGEGDLTLDKRTRVRNGYLSDFSYLVVFTPDPAPGR